MNIENITLIRFGRLEIVRSLVENDLWYIRDTEDDGPTLSLNKQELNVLYDVLKDVVGKEHDCCRSL